jgi:catechol-2,3-dioxygenase
MKNHFQINCLDHVALRVKNINTSSQWYQNVLGLKEYAPAEWGGIPVFLMAGQTGIALFPQKNQHTASNNPNYDHFAFNVDTENFELAKVRLKELEIPFDFQDHHFFHSIYFKDPDNNKVELTTIVVDPKEFFDL